MINADHTPPHQDLSNLVDMMTFTKQVSQVANMYIATQIYMYYNSF